MIEGVRERGVTNTGEALAGYWLHRGDASRAPDYFNGIHTN